MAANSLGGLIVTLGLDAAEFFTGLTRSEFEAKKFAARLDAGIATAANVATIAISAMGVAAIGAFHAINSLAKQAGDFQDLAEKTGANAEALASFAVAAGTANTAIADVAAASVKLTKNLTGVDDESKDAGAALTALGISIKDFKALDPAAQMEAVAKALAGFGEGAGKTAVAVALLSKSGADLLPFLKELGGETGRVNILTAEQIRLADEYSDKQARATATLQLYAQALATQALPAITAVTNTAKDFIKELLGIDAAGKGLRDSNAVADFANNAVRALAFIADAADSISRIFRVTGNVIGATAAQLGALADGDLKRYNAIQKDASDTIDAIISKQTIRFRLEKNIGDQARNSSLRAVEDRGFDPRAKVNFAGAVKRDSGGAEKISDAERYIESLEKQLQATLDLNAVELAEVEIYNLQSKALGGLTDARKALIRDYAEQIKAAKDSKDAIAAQKKEEEEAARIRERNSKDTTRRIESAQKEAQTIRDSNEQIQEQIAFLRGGEAGLRAYTDAKLAKAIAENLDKEAMLANAGASKEEIEAIHDITKALQERKAQLGQLDLAKQFAEEKKVVEDFANSISDSFANSFEGFISGTKSAKDSFKSFIGDVESMLIKLALKKLMNQILGMDDKGPDIFSMFAKLLGSFAGAAGGGAGQGYGTIGSNIPEGPYPYAFGTQSARGGLSLVGEHGPELIDLPRGARVIPNDVLRQKRAERSVSVVNNFTISGPISTASQRQIAAMARDAVMSAVKER